MEEYLNSQECGKFIKRTPGAVRNLVLRRAIPYRKAGGRLLFLRSEIMEWIEKFDGLRLVKKSVESIYRPFAGIMGLNFTAKAATYGVYAPATAKKPRLLRFTGMIPQNLGFFVSDADRQGTA